MACPVHYRVGIMRRIGKGDNRKRREVKPWHKRLRDWAGSLISGPLTWFAALRLTLCVAIAEVVALLVPFERSYWITLTVGIELLNRLTECHGRAAGTAANPSHAFPDPADLATVDPEALRRLGFSTAKGRALVELSAGGLDLERLSAVDDDEASGALQRLRGIGRWSAEYALLRGLGRLAVFPGDDVGARNNLQRLLGLDGDAGYDAVRRAVSPWSPYAGLAYFRLLLDHVDRAGWLNDIATSTRAQAT